MKEEYCKRLTLFIGECWHEKVPIPEREYEDREWFNDIFYCSCGIRQSFINDDWKFHVTFNRTFHTANDMQLVKDELVKRGEWSKDKGFYWFAWEKWANRDTEDYYGDEGFTDWLFSETEEGYRLCVLAAEFLGQKEDKG